MSFIQITIHKLDYTLIDKISDLFMDYGAMSISIDDAHEGSDAEQMIFGEPVHHNNIDIHASFNTNNSNINDTAQLQVSNSYDDDNDDNTQFWNQSKLKVLFTEQYTTTEVVNIIQNVHNQLKLYQVAQNLQLDIKLKSSEEAPELSVLELFQYFIDIIDDQDWVTLTQNQFQPITVTEELYIVPSWHNIDHPNAINIILDPGLAFGTGSHPTTFMCLKWIMQILYPIIKSNGAKNNISLLDYGCGSGILAIAAKKIACDKVFGLDIDKQAISSSTDNAKINQVDIQFFHADLLHNYVEQVDVLVANILSNPLRFLAPQLASLTKDKIILSGILEHQANELIGIYQQWFNITIFDTMDGWVLLYGTKL